MGMHSAWGLGFDTHEMHRSWAPHGDTKTIVNLLRTFLAASVRVDRRGLVSAVWGGHDQMRKGSTQLLNTLALVSNQRTFFRILLGDWYTGVGFAASSASNVAGAQQQRCGIKPGPQAMVPVGTLSHPSNTTCVNPNTMLDRWVFPRQQGSQHACQQQARQDAGRACTASNRGLIQHLALASVTPEESTVTAAAAGAHTQHKQPHQGENAAAAPAWLRVLQLLQGLTDHNPSSVDSSSSKNPPVAQHSSTVEDPQQQLSAALQAVVLDQAVPTAQQLLPLLAAAGAYHQQTPTRQLVAVLTSATAAALPQLLPQQLPPVLLALHSLQGGTAAAIGSQLGDSMQGGTATSNVLQAGRLQDSTSQATASQHGLESSILANPTVQYAGDPTKAHQQHASAVTKAVRSYLQQQQGALDPSSTAAIAAACAATQQRGTFTILAMLVLDHVTRMTSGQLVTVAAAFAAVQHYNQTVCEAIAQRAGTVLQQQGRKLQQQPLAGPAAAAGEGGLQLGTDAGPHLSADAATDVHPADHQQQQELEQQKQQQQRAASSFTAAELVGLLQAFARLRHYDAALLETGCTSLLRSPTRSLDLMARLVHTCALLNHFNLQLFETAVEMARGEMQQQQQQQQGEQQQQQQQQSSRLLSQQLAQLSWACGVMGHWEPSFVQQLCVWSADVDAKSLPAEELLQWHEVRFASQMALQASSFASKCCSGSALTANEYQQLIHYP
jgi:hypothetical protein